jgi:hypothetical protein
MLRDHLVVLLTLGACATAPEPQRFQSFGSMREVMRDGEHQGRAVIAEVSTPFTVGVGALEGLAGEVTIVDGVALVAQRDGGRVAVRGPRPGERAALLVVAEVDAWQEVSLTDCASYAALEEQVGAALVRLGMDPREPTPMRVTGRAERLTMHVIAGACPIAEPSGPAPWRFDGRAEAVALVGFYVEDAVGVLTHHSRKSHLHALVGGMAGHLDDVSLRDVRLLLPLRAL